MKLTLKENINTESFILRHRIIIQATSLLVGREGVLETEKNLYLILSFLDNIMNEDVVGLCNEDKRDLSEIIESELEPMFFDIIRNDRYRDLFIYCQRVLLNRCREIWDNQHSVIGLVDAILTAIANIPEETQKEALIETAKIAEAAFDRRTELMSKKTEETNSKLDELMKKYKTGIEVESNAE